MSKKPRIYNIWVNMRQRCTNPNWSDYHRYGGRGISFCDEWSSFDTFSKWAMSAGYSDELSIDREDNDLNYNPENCVWSTPKEQANNTSSNRRITYNGVTKNLNQWEELYGISRETISKRIGAGWSMNEVFTTPLNAHPKNMITYNGVKKPITQWSKDLGININTLRSRLRTKSIKEAFEKDVEHKYASR